jgi:chromosome segregation ATPase
LKEQLKQAIEERDILHQTVSLQTKEIATLKSGTATEACKDVLNDIVPQDGTAETDYDGSKVLILQNQVEELNAVIRDREKLAQEMKIQYETETRVLQERISKLQTMNDQLQLQIAELDRTASIERDDKIEDAKRLEAEKVELQGQLKMAQSDATVSQTKILDLERELEVTQGQLKVANERLVAISNPIATTEIDEKIGTDTTTNMSSSGELTSATGVKVALPSAMVSKIPKDDDDEEGWGDDWD